MYDRVFEPEFSNSLTQRGVEGEFATACQMTVFVHCAELIGLGDIGEGAQSLIIFMVICKWMALQMRGLRS